MCLILRSVTTKLWNTFHHKDNVRPSFEKQLKDLGLTYVDLYLIHCEYPWKKLLHLRISRNLTWHSLVPIPLKHVPIETAYPPGWYQPGAKELEFERSPMQDCWREMEKLVEAGLARNIGISNFNVQLILDLLTYAKIKPAVLQGKVL